MSKDYPVHFSSQLRQHLRALRKKRGLTQAQLGALVGVSQARIAEIEANPGLVNLDQMLQLLAALGTTLMLQELEEDGSTATTTSQPKPARTPDKMPEAPKTARAARTRAKEETVPSPQENPGKPAQFGWTTRPKKGSW